MLSLISWITPDAHVCCGGLVAAAVVVVIAATNREPERQKVTRNSGAVTMPTRSRGDGIPISVTLGTLGSI